MTKTTFRELELNIGTYLVFGVCHLVLTQMNFQIHFKLPNTGATAFLIYEITPLGKKRTTVTNKNP